MSNPAAEAFNTGTTETGEPAASNLAVFAPLVGATPTTSTGVVTDTNPVGRFFTEEDLNKARAQEKDKLYPQMETLRQTVERLTAAEQAREAAAQAVAEEAAAADRKRVEDEMSVRDLLTQKEQEWEARFSAERDAREQADALLERERAFQALQQYRADRMAQEQDNIMPELLDLVDGSTEAEIESSIAGLKERTSRIFDSAASAFQQNRVNMAGSRVTSPAAGPLDNDSAHKTFTAEEIAAMPFADYVKHRGALLGQAASGRNKGMFG